MTAYGADPAALDALEQLLTKTAATIDGIGSQLASRLHSTKWLGANAEQFRDHWSRVYLPSLREAHVELSAAATVLANNAREQRDASVASGGQTAGPSNPIGSGREAELQLLLHDLYFNVVPKALDLAGTTIGFMAREGIKVGALGPLLSVIGIGYAEFQTYHDLANPGSFGNEHLLADGFGLVGATLMTIAPFVPPPADVVVGGIGIVSDGVGYGINEAVSIWDKEGGRQAWNTLEPWASHELDAAGRAVWNTAYSGVTNVAQDGQQVASGAWHAVSGWL
jgi:hypothetical protein